MRVETKCPNGRNKTDVFNNSPILIKKASWRHFPNGKWETGPEAREWEKKKEEKENGIKFRKWLTVYILPKDKNSRKIGAGIKKIRDLRNKMDKSQGISFKLMNIDIFENLIIKFSKINTPSFWRIYYFIYWVLIMFHYSL